MPRRLLDWKFGLAATVAVVAFLFLAGRIVAYRIVEREGLIVRPNTGETPMTYGAPAEPFTFASGGRTLDAMIVRAPSDSAPVIVIFHGTAEAVSNWADVQALWYRHGISSMVFDYSGFGRSTGTPTAERCNEDARAAYDRVRLAFGPQHRYYVLGYSLGTGIMMGALPLFAPQPEGVMLVAGYSSARDGAMEFLKLPSYVRPLLPNIWDTIAGVRQLTQPLLVVHSSRDEKFPVWMPRAVAAAAPTAHQFVLHAEPYSHDEGHRRPTEEYWAPVVAFASTGHLSTAQLEVQPR